LLDDMPKEDLKKLPSDITTYGFYSATRGDAVTYFKKDDLTKGNVFTVPDLSNLKGGEKQMGEGTVTYTQEQVDALTKEAVDKAVAEALANVPKVEETQSEVFVTKEQATAVLGKELPADKVLSYAKEGEAFMTQLVNDAVAMGVRAQCNDFPAETWKNTFAGMGSQGIKDIMATFEKQVKEEIPVGRKSHAGVGKGQAAKVEIPDDCYKV